MPGFYFLKLGGSLITDKNQPLTPRKEVIVRLAGEIASVLAADPGIRLVIGHGSGSFGHVPARQYGTRQGVRSPSEWRGFTEVWRAAATLNQIVIEALIAQALPVISLPPSAMVLADHTQIVAWEVTQISMALEAGLIPVIYGDVVFDRSIGGTILSTEDLFSHLAPLLRPERILLAGIEDGVWKDYPTCTQLVPEIAPHNLQMVLPALSGSRATDVTGGMASKVLQSLAIVSQLPDLEILIFSAARNDILAQVLQGIQHGTRISAA